jgi:hypothetical protein
METKNVEVTLPEDSIFRALAGENKVVESDEEYNTMMNSFLAGMRIQAQRLNTTPVVIQNSPNKLKIASLREQLADGRRPLKFRKGFLNTKHESTS